MMSVTKRQSLWSIQKHNKTKKKHSVSITWLGLHDCLIQPDKPTRSWFISIKCNTITEHWWISVRGISSWCDNAVTLQNVKSSSPKRPERMSRYDSVNNREISQSLLGYCACVWEWEPTCERGRSSRNDDFRVYTALWLYTSGITLLGRPVALLTCNGFRDGLENLVCEWLFTHHPVFKSSICLDLIPFAQSHVTSTAQSTFTLTEQLFWAVSPHDRAKNRKGQKNIWWRNRISDERQSETND